MTSEILRKLRPAFLIATLAGIPLVIMQVPGWRPADFLSRRWAAQLPNLPESQLVPTLRQIAQLGDDYLPLVVEAMTSPRPAVSEAARSVINERISRWKMLQPAASTPHLARLAAQIASIAPKLDKPNREFAADLAGRMLSWPVQKGTAQSAQLVRDCETILFTTATSEHRWASKKTRDDSKNPNTGDDDSMESASVDVIPAEAVPTGILRPGRSVPGSGRAATFATLSDDPPDKDESEEEGEPEVESASIPRSLDLKDDLRSLIKQLHSADLRVSSQAIAKLRKRGFNDRQFEVAMQLDDANPAVRQQLAELVISLSDFDPRPWLLWLSEDSDVSVRRTVAAIMATSDDPLLVRRLQIMEQQDSDQEVVLLARRALRTK